MNKSFPLNLFQEESKTRTPAFRKRKIRTKTIFIAGNCITVGDNGSDSEPSDLHPVAYVEIHFVLYLYTTGIVSHVQF